MIARRTAEPARPASHPGVSSPGDAEAARTLLHDASRKLDKAVSKGVIHANQAANKKSAMAQRANSL